MPSITFRLKSSKYVGTIDMEGAVISCREIQEAVAQKLGAALDEISVFTADRSDLLHPREELPAYAVVDIIRRVAPHTPFFARPTSSTPAATSSDGGFASARNDFKRSRPGPETGTAGGKHSILSTPSIPPAPLDPLRPAGKAIDSTFTPIADPNKDRESNKHSTPTHPGPAPLTEEERLAQLQAEVGWDTGLAEGGFPGRRGGRFRGAFHFSAGRGGGAEGGGGNNAFSSRATAAAEPATTRAEEFFRPPPKGYLCHNCGKAGHYIQHCPSAKAGRHLRMLALPVGIPESMLVECAPDDPAPKFITRDHRLVKRRVDPDAGRELPVWLDTLPSASPPVREFAATERPTPGARPTPSSEVAVGPSGASAASHPDSNNTHKDKHNDLSNPTHQAHERTDKLAVYRCVVDGTLSKHRMRLPCCHRRLCRVCFDRIVERAFDSLDDPHNCDHEDGEGLACPNCNEPLLLDDVLSDTEGDEEVGQV